MAITMTEPAAARVKTFLANRGKGVGMRIGIKTNGCSGMSYVLEFVDEIIAGEDEVFDVHGVTVVVDKKSLVYVNGTEVDFVKDGLNEGFKFSNPNEKGQCGCGESFTV